MTLLLAKEYCRYIFDATSHLIARYRIELKKEGWLYEDSCRHSGGPGLSRLKRPGALKRFIRQRLRGATCLDPEA
jgi:hypothetical protein